MLSIRGEYARKTAEEIRAAGGLLTEADFAAYVPVERRPACSEFNGHRVLGAAGASAGPYVIEMLNVAEAAGAGAAYIPGAIAQVILRVAGLQQDLYAALAAPRMNPTATGGLEIEAGFTLPVYQQLRAHGYAPSTRIADLMFAAVHAIAQREDGTLIGAADPRRDGAAAGY